MPSVVTMTGPGTATVTDDAAAAIALQTVAITTALNTLQATLYGPGIPPAPALPGSIGACLSGINSSLTRIADYDKAIAKSISDLNIAIGSMAVSTSALTSITAHAAANQITTNNYQVQATTEALERSGLPPPSLPSEEDQLKAGVTSGLALHAAGVAQGAIGQFVTTNTLSLGQWIGETSAYQTVAGWVNQAKDSLISVLPPSVQSALDKAKGGPT